MFIFQFCYFVDYDVSIIYRIYYIVHYVIYPETHNSEVTAKGHGKLLNVFKNVYDAWLTPFFFVSHCIILVYSHYILHYIIYNPLYTYL